MKTFNRILVFFIALSMLGFTACEKKYDTEGLSQITNYATFDVTGGSVIVAPLGTPFTDPGVTATEAGNPIDVAVSVSGVFTGYSGTTVDANTADKYLITYSATNGDGFTGSAQRTVWIAGDGDLVSSIEGLYTATIIRNGVEDPQYADLQYVMIWSEGGNVYGISDAIGGYYDLGRGYGNGYRAAGMTVTANDIGANDFTYGGPIGVGAFGGVLEMTGFTVTPPSTINFSSHWSFDYDFDVTLTKVEF